VTGPRWRRQPWREASYVVVDVETTGLDLRTDDVVSYGVVLVEEGRVRAASATYGLVRPALDPRPSAVQVHALRSADLMTAPSRSAAAGELAGLLHGRVLVAHAAWVERAFLGRLLRDVGERLRGPVVDTAALARAAGVAPRAGSAEPALERLAHGLGVPPHTPHHALGDALTTASVFLVLATRLERERGAGTVGSLVRLSRRLGAGR
jgi:DNA polymerase III subunit epsilon